MALLASIGPLEATELRGAIDATFSFRNTHPVPRTVPPPPLEWLAAYERMAAEDELAWKTLSAVHKAAESFLTPLLQGTAGTWNQADWRWK